MDGSVFPRRWLACGLLLSQLWLVPGVDAAVPDFGPISSATTPTPAGVAIADFDGDGIPDLAIADPTIGVVVIQKGNGDGTFGAPVAVFATGNPFNLISADLNHDGKPDLIVGDGNTAHTTVLLNNGDGTFSVAATLAAEPANTLRLVDYNGDGIPDLLVVGAGGASAVQLFPGNGDGSFGSPVVVDPGFSVADAAMGDLDGDGLQDLVLADYAGVRVAVLHATAVGRYAAPSFLATTDSPNTLALVSDAASGHLDLAVSEDAFNQGSATATVEVFAGGAGGSLTLAHQYRLSSPDLAMSVADVSGDGVADLVLLNGSDDSVSVLLGLGGGAYADGAVYKVGYTPYGFAVGDVDGDGEADIITTSSNAGTVSTLLNHGQGRFDQSMQYMSPTYAVGSASSISNPADLDGDGSQDVVALSYDVTNNQLCTVATTLLNDGKGTLRNGPASTLICGGSLEGGVFEPGVPLQDMDGDGKPDLVMIEGNSIAVAKGNGDGSFAPAALYTAHSTALYSDVSVGDVDGDGRPDVMVEDMSTDSIFVFLQQVDGSFAPGFTVPPPNGEWLVTAAVADLAQDGHKEIITGTAFNDYVLVYPVLPGGAGVGTPVSYATPITGSEFAVADVNNDGYPDLVVWDHDGISVLLNKGDGTFAAYVHSPGFGSCDTPRVADLDGDGKLDVVCLTTDKGFFSVYYGNGDGTFRAGPSYSGVELPFSFYLADMNGDGLADIVAGTTFIYPPLPFADTYSVPSLSVFLQRPTATVLPPVSVPAHYYLDMDTAVEFHPVAESISGGAITTGVVMAPPNGSIAPSTTHPGDLVYTPNHHFHGWDKFTFSATGADGSSNIATVYFEVLDTNRTPTQRNFTVSTKEGASVSGQVKSADPDGDSLVYSLAYQPSRGRVILTDAATGSYVYTPQPGFSGQDEFAYYACDWDGACGGGTVTVDVQLVGTELKAGSATIAVTAGTTYSGTLPASYIKGDVVSFSIRREPDFGTLTLTDASKGTYTYSAPAGYTGAAPFLYSVSDRNGSAQAWVSLDVAPARTPPAQSGGGAFNLLVMGLLGWAWRMRRAAGQTPLATP